jgi:hypothetical protein
MLSLQAEAKRKEQQKEKEARFRALGNKQNNVHNRNMVSMVSQEWGI